MASRRSLGWALLVCCCSMSLAQALDGSPALASPLDSTFPEVRILTRIPLPPLPTLHNSFELNISVARIIGPGDNASSSDPYVEYTGRVYNLAITPGVARTKQGETFNFNERKTTRRLARLQLP